MARTLPARTCGSDATTVSMPTGTCPAITDVKLCELPLKGTWVILVPIVDCSSSAPKCADEPLPNDA